MLFSNCFFCHFFFDTSVKTKNAVSNDVYSVLAYFNLSTRGEDIIGNYLARISCLKIKSFRVSFSPI